MTLAGAEYKTRMEINDTTMPVYNNISYGQQSVASSGTAEAINGGTTITLGPGGKLAIRADSGNAGSIYVGDSGVSSSNGFVLDPGESVSISVADVSTIYIDADNNGDGVSWLVEAS